MKKALFTLVFVAVAALAAQAQEDKSKRPSPPATATATVNGKKVTIDYSRPSVKGRNVWAGDMAPYGKVWRTGANESTTFEVSQDVTIEGKTLPAGKYALFSIPGEKEWTLIFNKTPKWGAYTYKEADDVLRVKVPAKKAPAFTEQFTINVDPKGTVGMMWENVMVAFAVK